MSEKASADHVVWDLGDLYSGPRAPELEADRSGCGKQAEEFAAAYRGRVAALSAPELHDAIVCYEALRERLQRLAAFAYLWFSTRTREPEAGSLWQAMLELQSAVDRDTLFFELEWTQVDEERARELLAHPALASYRHYLEIVRKFQPHLLSEPEERIMAELAPVGARAWCTLFDKTLSGLQYGEGGRTQAEVLSDLHHSERDVRKRAADELTSGLEGVGHILTHIFNTVLLDKAIVDRLRRHPDWLHERNLANEADDSMVAALIEAVSGRYDIVQRYYGLKRRLLGFEQLFDYDRYAPVAAEPERAFSWDQTRDMVLAAFREFSHAAADIAELFFERGWIHAPVLHGKRAGAFAHPTVPDVHPYIMVNFTGSHRDVMTLAHELGHGVHQYLAREQGLFNSRTPLTMAETASVFGEMLVFRHLLAGLEDPRERLALICAKLEDAFATVFRQVAMNRFEDAAHNARRERGELSAEAISDLWMHTQRAMFGDSVELGDHYRSWWSYIPHFLHTPGYVYAYAFGQLLVLALYGQYREQGPSFVPLYLELLRAGGKERPQELLSPFGIDLNDPGFWHRGLAELEELLAEAEAQIEE